MTKFLFYVMGLITWSACIVKGVVTSMEDPSLSFIAFTMANIVLLIVLRQLMRDIQA